MQSSRDSSILRSLAIAFGDGLAFGVGMKITQQSGRAPSSSLPAPADPPILDRIEEIERRVQKVEKLPAPIASAAPGQALDQQVLEAIVGSLDARLLEQSTQTERRLRDLEAKLTIELKTLHKQDHSVATGLQERMVELHEQFSGQVAEIRKHSEAAHIAYRTELAALHRQFAVETAKTVEAGLNAKDAQLQQRADTLKAALDEHTRTALARHQILESGMAAQSAGLGRRIEDLRAGLSAETAGLVEAALERRAGDIQQQMAALRQSADERAQSADARHLALESSLAAQSAGLGRRIEDLRAGLSAETAGLVEAALERRAGDIQQQMAALRQSADERAQSADARHFALESSLAAQNAEVAGLLEETRAASVAESSRHIEEAIAKSNAAFASQFADLRASIEDHARAAAARDSENLAKFDARIAALHAEFTSTAAHLVRERVARAIEEQVVPLRAEVAAKDRELQHLRQRLAESDRNAASMMLAIGQACRDAAERFSPSLIAPDAPKPETADPALAGEQTIVACGSDEGLPGFVQSKPPGKLLRIPLVSSMAMVMAAGAAILHFL